MTQPKIIVVGIHNSHGAAAAALALQLADRASIASDAQRGFVVVDVESHVPSDPLELADVAQPGILMADIERPVPPDPHKLTKRLEQLRLAVVLDALGPSREELASAIQALAEQQVCVLAERAEPFVPNRMSATEFRRQSKFNMAGRQQAFRAKTRR